MTDFGPAPPGRHAIQIVAEYLVAIFRAETGNARAGRVKLHQLVIDHKLPSVPNIHWNSAPFRSNTLTHLFFGRVPVSGRREHTPGQQPQPHSRRHGFHFSVAFHAHAL